MEELKTKENSVLKAKVSTSAKILIATTGGVAIGLSLICASFVAPAFRRICLPFVPATTEQVSNVLNLLPKNSTGPLLDIGSGDGRIVIAAAKRGFRADGVELNPWLVFYSQLAALQNGVFQQTRFFRANLWNFNVKPYKYVIIFGVEQMMGDLEKKLIKETLHDTQVIACRFPFLQLQPERTIEDGINSVWLYNLRKKNNCT